MFLEPLQVPFRPSQGPLKILMGCFIFFKHPWNIFRNLFINNYKLLKNHFNLFKNHTQPLQGSLEPFQEPLHEQLTAPQELLQLLQGPLKHPQKRSQEPLQAKMEAF